MANVNLQSVNVPEHFIRHAAFLGELTRFGSPSGDFAFTIVPRGGGAVAIRSVNFPTRFLRHRDFRIHLEGPNGGNDQLWRDDSTFGLVRGLSDANGVSFRSVNVPDRFIRHRDFHLWLEGSAGPGDALFRRDATFVRRPASVHFDHGTALNPVDD